MNPTQLFTIGYGGRKPAEMTALLRQHAVATVVDVRLRPDRAAMGVFAKAKSADKGVERVFSEAGIGYVSLIELGNPFVDLEDWEPRYRRLLESAGDLLVERLASVPHPFCLMCAEKDPAACHRRLIAEFLARKGWGVKHLL